MSVIIKRFFLRCRNFESNECVRKLWMYAEYNYIGMTLMVTRNACKQEYIMCTFSNGFWYVCTVKLSNDVRRAVPFKQLLLAPSEIHLHNQRLLITLITL